MQQIKLNFSQTSSEILIGAGALRSLREHMSGVGLEGLGLVVSQPRVLKAIDSRALGRLPLVTIPEGESAKTMGTVSRLIDRMVSHGLTRQSAIVALGGGVVGDVAGFAASVYLRGIAVVQVPTTLLAQVDSSVGGKTGVNHRAGKNLIGSFHQPRLVIVDPAVLASLPPRQYSSGLYEALKYGVIRDRALFLSFGRNREAILRRDVPALEELISGCLRIKAAVVGADEREGDLRRILNFGHTIGHALETAAKYRRILHGEAVGYGMLAAHLDREGNEKDLQSTGCSNRGCGSRHREVAATGRYFCRSGDGGDRSRQKGPGRIAPFCLAQRGRSGGDESGRPEEAGSERRGGGFEVRSMRETPKNRERLQGPDSRVVRQMFADIAPSYDFLNHFLSLSIDRRWRRRAVGFIASLEPDPADLCLDLCSGTGDLSIELHRRLNLQVVSSDFCHPMLSESRKKLRSAGFGDAVHLTEADASSCRLRTAASRSSRSRSDFEISKASNAALQEMGRVLEPDGSLVILEFSRSVLPLFGRFSGSISGTFFQGWER